MPTAHSTKYLDSMAQRLNKIKRTSWFQITAISIMRDLLLACVTVGLWATVQPEHPTDLILVGAASLIGVLVFSRRPKREEIDVSEFMLYLEIKYPNTKHRISSLTKATPQSGAAKEWEPHLDREIEHLKSFEKNRRLTYLTTMILPAIIATLIFSNSKPAIGVALQHVAAVVLKSKNNATLSIIQGAASIVDQSVIKISMDHPARLKLLDRNLVKLSIGIRSSVNAPIITLKQILHTKKAAPTQTDQNSIDQKNEVISVDVFQQFQLSPTVDASKSSYPAEDEHTHFPTLHQYSVTFSIEDSVALYIDHISKSRPLAFFTIKKQPIPTISLQPAVNLKDPWPDDKPLPLLVKAQSKSPLAKINLIIRTGRKEIRELVSNVMNNTTNSLSSTYKLLLEPYLQSDWSEIVILAEAIDRSSPSRAGYSKVIKLRVASAYGRYRKTLQTLRNVKKMIDKSISGKMAVMSPEADQKIAEASLQSMDSPFFDALDRIEISRFKQEILRNRKSPSLLNVYEISSKINNFLFEHEILDDRERDRDFFVAARGLSRLLETRYQERPVAVETATDRLVLFLQTRAVHWKARVKKLAPGPIHVQWKKMERGRPFQKMMQEISRSETHLSPKNKDSNEQQTQSKIGLETLSKAVREYRNWINTLEAEEDSQRQKQEQKRQKGLSSARNEIRELQKKQGQISTALDKASARDQQKLSESWPAVKMKQKSNIKGTKRLEGKLRSLSPSAARRIKASVEAMNKTVISGDQQSFVSAETRSDFAGRLLRQADKAAQKSQRPRRSRGRRRRVSGDNYYGQSVVSDIKVIRDYKVDRRYREAILDEIRGADVEDKDKALLDHYLQKIVR